ncbi:MAG: transposase family protein [Bacteroidota bacterium]
MPDTFASWRYGKFDGKFYYDYDRLPDGRKQQLPSKEGIIKQYNEYLAENRQDDLLTNLKNALESDYKAYLRYYSNCTSAQSRTLAKACAIIEASVCYMNENRISIKKSRFFKDLSTVLSDLDIGYIPRNWRRLKEKVEAVYNGADVVDLINLPRSGNSNARKHEDKRVKSWVYIMRSMPNNYTNAHIIRKIRQVCEMSGIPKPSESWFNQILAKPHTKNLTARGRYGSSKRGDVYKGYMPLENAIFAGDCWQVDGTRINFIGHQGRDGKEEFLYVITIMDVHSGDLVGWHFDTKEDRWGYVHALKMAANNTGYLPWELVTDKFPGHNTPEWRLMTKRLEQAGTKVTVTSLKTGKAKAERKFRTLQEVFMQESKYYYGEGVQSRNAYAHRSPEYLKQIRKVAKAENWDFTASWNEAARIFELYRTTKYSEYSKKFKRVDKSPRQMHDESDKPHVVRLEPWSFIEMFGLEKQVSIRNAGIIKTTIQRMDYVYQVEEYDTLKAYKTVRLCYDMEDLGTVHLYEDSDEITREYLGAATEVRAVQMYGPNADKSTVGKAKKRIKKIKENMEAELEEITSGGEELAILLAGMNPKPTTSLAETAWLKEREGDWRDDNKPRIINMKKEEDDFDGSEQAPEIDVRELL